MEVGRSLRADSEAGFEFLELFAEAGVGLAAGPFRLDHLQAVLEVPFVFLHHVGDQQSRASRNSSRAMHQHVGLFAGFVDEVVGRFEGVAGVLGVAVVEVELEVPVMFGVLEVQIDAGADGCDVVLFEFLEVVREIVTADPDFAQIAFTLEHFLACVVKGTVGKHLNLNYKLSPDHSRKATSHPPRNIR